MTSTAIVEHLAREFSASGEHVRAVLDMLDAGLCAPYIGRVRRAETGGLSETAVRRIAWMRTELEELDRRRGTIVRLLEATPGVEPAAIDRVRACMDRFELEDLFVPHRRPEPEVQLALDRGLGKLADALVAPMPGAPAPDHSAAADAPHGAQEDRVDEPHGDAAPQGEDRQHETEALRGARESEVAPPAEEGAHGEVPSHESGDEHASSEVAPSDAAHAERAAVPQDALETVSSKVDDGEHEGAHADSRSGDNAAAGAPAADASEAALHGEIELTPALARACAPFVSPDKGVHTEMEALTGAMRILSDRLGRSASLRGLVRRTLRKHGVLSVRALIDEDRLGRHKPLLRIRQPLRQIQGHRLLAIRQAQKERAVATVISLDRAVVLPKVRAALGKRNDPDFNGVLDTIALRSLERRLLPAVDADVRLELKERADDEALRFLAQHLRQVLLTPPFPRRVLAGVDINAKGDWTLAVIDETGNVLGDYVRIEVGEKDAAALGAELKASLEGKDVRALAIAHGKVARAAQAKLRAALVASGVGGFIALVNEAGLASYANSELARQELPNSNVPQRMAVSLARRLQDPLCEVLKIEPRHLSLGSEQGLVSKANVRRVLRETIESCVAYVGCDVNTAPAVLLEHVAGLDREAAKKIVARRAERAFDGREDLRNSGIVSEAQWTSSIAFLRVPGSSERFDNTSLHPEQYPLARRLLEATGGAAEEMLGRPGVTKGLRRVDFEVDEYTWRDLMRELAYPGRDPRPRNFEPRLLDPQTDPVTLTKDRVVEGVVSNVMGFGAFVDVGLDREGLIHISEMSERYVRDARELLSIGQVVRARIVDAAGQRIALSLKNVPEPEREPRRPRFERGGDRRERGGDRRSGPGGGHGGGRERRENKPPAPVRAAQSRRDGLLPGSSPDRLRERRGGGGPRGRGRDQDRGEHVRPEDLRSATGTPVRYTPFASFFKKDKDEA